MLVKLSDFLWKNEADIQVLASAQHRVTSASGQDNATEHVSRELTSKVLLMDTWIS
jgi:hypothetical protein